MELTATLLRTIFMYLFIFLIMRIMGKREIGKLSVFDLVISIMIAEIAVIVIESTDKALLSAVAPILLLVLIQIGIAFLSLKSRKARLLIDGEPSVLIRNGHLNRTEMFRQRYNLDDLLIQLRENQVANIEDVELAVLESSGKLSVITKERGESEPGREGSGKSEQERSREADRPDKNLKIRYEVLPIPLIMDGQVQDENLEKIGKNRFWLKGELQSREIESFKEVFFCSIDHRGKLYVDKK
ncbi:DUF421 domain-containing protein [Paenibacillaceae bacterium WGS1546]|uniref:DUF421 domain-containing protein n=1 Tax=Cohnella sp. WGS1546 TaxID=3366810 RepID=UPI00372D2456